jgi:hypothetical protein
MPSYTSPGFIVGIPAVPIVIPFLFGVGLLQCAGDQMPLQLSTAQLLVKPETQGEYSLNNNQRQ